jgi:hypothetical protein
MPNSVLPTGVVVLDALLVQVQINAHRVQFLKPPNEVEKRAPETIH